MIAASLPHHHAHHHHHHWDATYAAMSKVDAQVTVGGDVSSRKKRKRTRKGRTRIEAADASSEQEGEEQLKRKSAQVATVSADESEKCEKDEKDHQIGMEGVTDKTKDKRKRKRTRGKARKEESGVVDTVGQTSSATDQESATPSASMQQYLDSLGDPQDSRDVLCEKTANALGYARQYHLARSDWKFNKAKQEYLIRHMLTPPPAQSAGGIVGNQQDAEKETEGDGDDIASTPDQQHWPDEWNHCVAKYLATIRGRARERLFDVLTMAAKQVIPAEPVQVVSAADLTAGVPAANTATKKKSVVSFGDLAMAQEAAGNETSESSTSINAADVQRRHFQKDRATKLLAELQD